MIDVQNGIINFGNFNQELLHIENIIKDFKQRDEPVIFLQHFDRHEDSPLHRNAKGSHLYEPLKDYADYVIQKHTLSSFYQTNLANVLEELNVNHIFITGFNTEYCCMFTAIAAFDRGYKVTYIEDATGTVNTAQTYDMPGLDIKDFVGTVLHWSDVIEVLYYDEYVERYQS